MDISETLAPKSDQLDAVDLLGGPRIFTVAKVDVRSSAEQPVTVHLAEFPRPWKPGKNMRRVLAGVWGVKSAAWQGRRVELFCDPSVVYAGQEVGGIRIRAVSHIEAAKKVPIIPTRGKSALYTVQPLPDAPPAAPDDGTQTQLDALRSEWMTATDERKAEIQAEVAALSGGAS